MHIQVRNLLHWVKKECTNAQTMNKFLLTNPSTERRIGALPVEWVKDIPKAERSSVTQQIHDAFQRFSSNTAEIRGDNYYDYFAGHAEDFVPEQNKLLDMLKNFLKRDDISIQYIDSGQLKNCSKITVGDKSYALSTFRRHCTKFNDYFEPTQGRGYEPQMLFTAYKRGSHGRYAKPFMANVSSEKDDGGYILSKYIEENHPPKKYKSDLLRSREYTKNGDTKSNDRFVTEHNTINGICIEAGGVLDNSSRYLSNPQEREIWYNLANKLNSEVELLSKITEINGKRVNMQKISDYLLQLKNNGVDLCTSDSRSILKELTAEEQKAAIKYIRILKKTRALKNELIQQGQFEKYQTMLNEDLRLNFRLCDSSRKYSNSHLEDIQEFPQLIADELDISNTPTIESLFHWVDRGIVKEKALTDLFTEAQLKDYITKNYDTKSIEYCKSTTYLSKIFDISREKQILKIQGDLKYYEEELTDYDTPSILGPMYSKNELIEKINSLKKALEDFNYSL